MTQILGEGTLALESSREGKEKVPDSPLIMRGPVDTLLLLSIKSGMN